MYKFLNKRIMPYVVGVGIGLGVLSNVYADESGENFGKAIVNIPTQIVRGVFGIVGIDVVREKWDPLTIGRAANDLVGKEVEYIAGIASGEKTDDLNEQGFIDELVGEGLVGNIERGAITGAGIGGVVGAVRSAGYGSVLAHHINPVAAGAIYGSGAGAVKGFAEETMKGGR